MTFVPPGRRAAPDTRPGQGLWVLDAGRPYYPWRKLAMLGAADVRGDLRVPPGNRLVDEAYCRRRPEQADSPLMGFPMAR